MLRATIDAGIRFRLLLVLGAAVLLVVGGTQLSKAPADVLPEFGQPTVQIQTESLGLSAPEVEQLITVPMESNLINGVPGVESVQSHPRLQGLRRWTLATKDAHGLYAPLGWQPLKNTERWMEIYDVSANPPVTAAAS